MATKTVLITGASRGIGLALAKQYAKANWKVIAGARNPETADQLRAVSPFKIVQLDTSDQVSVQNAATELENESIDVVINNAGVGKWRSFMDTTKEQLMKTFEVNTVGPFLVTQAFQPHLARAAKEHESATVAMISSDWGSISLASGGHTAYGVSKAALNMLTACAAMELKTDGIVVLALHPGWVITDLSGNGNLTPEQSASDLANIISQATMEKTGKFFNWQGQAMPW